jgi:hypothetical protein
VISCKEQFVILIIASDVINYMAMEFYCNVTHVIDKTTNLVSCTMLHHRQSLKIIETAVHFHV